MSSTTTDLLQQIAGRLREARMRKYASAAAAARALGVNEVTLRAHESGQNGIPSDLMLTYCRAYDIDLNWLMRGHKVAELKMDRLRGLELSVDGALRPKAFVELGGEDGEPPLDIPSVSPMFGLEIYSVATDVWTDFPRGSHLLCAPADAVAVQAGDLVVAQQMLGDLAELTLWRLDYTGGDELGLHSLSGDGEVVMLTGPDASNRYIVRAVAHQHVRTLQRPGARRNIIRDVPILQRSAEAL